MLIGFSLFEVCSDSDSESLPLPEEEELSLESLPLELESLLFSAGAVTGAAGAAEFSFFFLRCFLLSPEDEKSMKNQF